VQGSHDHAPLLTRAKFGHLLHPAGKRTGGQEGT
jgi:hypothetical protein